MEPYQIALVIGAGVCFAGQLVLAIRLLLDVQQHRTAMQELLTTTRHTKTYAMRQQFNFSGLLCRLAAGDTAVSFSKFLHQDVDWPMLAKTQKELMVMAKTASDGDVSSIVCAVCFIDQFRSNAVREWKVPDGVVGTPPDLKEAAEPEGDETS